MFSGVGCKYSWDGKQGILCDFHIEVAKEVAKCSFRTHGPASRGSCLTSTLKWLKRSQSVPSEQVSTFFLVQCPKPGVWIVLCCKYDFLVCGDLPVGMSPEQS